MTTTYEAKQDNVGALVPLRSKRRCVVVKYHNGKFGYVCGTFSTLKAAQARADWLNASERAAVNDYAGDGLDARWEDAGAEICGR